VKVVPDLEVDVLGYVPGSLHVAQLDEGDGRDERAGGRDEPGKGLPVAPAGQENFCLRHRR
jgi:hypothetical protein